MNRALDKYLKMKRGMKYDLERQDNPRLVHYGCKAVRLLHVQPVFHCFSLATQRPLIGHDSTSSEIESVFLQSSGGNGSKRSAQLAQIDKNKFHVPLRLISGKARARSLVVRPS